MFDIVDILVFYGYVSELLKNYWEAGKEWTRLLLGPSPNTTYLLFENDEVIPNGMEHCKYSVIAFYNPAEHRITRQDGVQAYKRLPWLSVQHVIGDHVVDLSDWIADIRANVPITLIAILRLAAQVQGRHLPETEHATVRVVTRDGEEQEFRYQVKTRLLQRIAPTPVELRRKQTCPFDTNEGMPLF
jgi:hypothetical protein